MKEILKTQFNIEKTIELVNSSTVTLQDDQPIVESSDHKNEHVLEQKPLIQVVEIDNYKVEKNERKLNEMIKEYDVALEHGRQNKDNQGMEIRTK